MSPMTCVFKNILAGPSLCSMKLLNKPNQLNNILGAILAFIALNAFGGGYYGMSGAKDIPLSWLEGSPFANYLVPSIFLFAAIGGLAATSSILVFKHHRLAYNASVLTSIVLLLWLSIQVAIIGYVSWMQPFTALLSLGVLFISAILSSPGTIADRFQKRD